MKFALGARSPEKKNYFKSKFFVTPEESRLKGIEIENVNNSKTVYNMHGGGGDQSLSMIKN